MWNARSTSATTTMASADLERAVIFPTAGHARAQQPLSADALVSLDDLIMRLAKDLGS
jgi:hypothetical protein